MKGHKEKRETKSKKEGKKGIHLFVQALFP